jgi:hypothetical protein
VVSGSVAVSQPDRLRIDQGSQYIMFNVIQGQSVQEILGSSSGLADQQFSLNRTPYVLGSARVFVNEGSEFEWAVVDSLRRSLSTDRHVIVDPQVDGTAIVQFGDGTNGRIPPLGSNSIRATYRIGADDDGNIGAETLTVNRDGVGIFKNIWNPRQGQYWIEADWSSQAALERAKDRGPKQLSTMYRAVTPRDCEVLSRSFINSNDVRPVERAKAYEGTLGPKTIELIVCGGGGAALTSDEREELQEYFNGGEIYGYNGVIVANQEVFVTNYSPKEIALTVRVTARPVITEEIVLQALSRLLSPTAVQKRGVNYVWRLGQDVPLSRIEYEIFDLSPGNVFDVDVTSPTADITLDSRELPVLNFSGTQVVIIEPDFD